MTDRFSFIPNLRLGASADAEMAEDGRLTATYDVAILGNGDEQGSRIGVDARFRGPGDVIGIVPTQIARVEPPDGTGDFEVDYFPFVELTEADLPWRYSLSSNDSDRAAPWFVLIALKADEFVRLGQGTAPLPRIRVHSISASLPPLGQRWSTTHVQITGTERAEAARTALKNDPGRGFARAMCLRKLEPKTWYTLFLVPAYESGRQAGLGRSVTATDARAWENNSDAAIDLPYYFTSRFRTDEGVNLEAAFEKLRAISPEEATELAKPAPFFLHRPGYYPDLKMKVTEGEVQTALVAQGATVGTNPTPDPLKKRIGETLDEVILGETSDPEEDPLVAFPPYGFRYSDKTNGDDPQPMNPNGRDWLAGANFDPRHRLSAALGARIVRKNQEEFAALAWEQYQELLEANRQIARLQAAEKLAGLLTSRHFNRLPSDAAISLSEPITPYTKVRETPATAHTLSGVLTDQGSPTAFATRDLRRISARHQAHDQKTGARAIAAPALPGDQTPSPISRKRPNSQVRQTEQVIANRNDALFVQRDLQQLFRPDMIGPVVRPAVPAVNVGTFESKVMHRDLSTTLSSLPRVKADFRVTGRSEPETKDGGPIYRAPRLAVHLVDYMVRIQPEALLAGAQDLPDDSITFFEENRSFVEAVLLGANHAMNDELRWRAFATDMRGTLFPRFWNRGAAADNKSQDDIGEILTWRKGLGTQRYPANPDHTKQLVVVVKGEVVRKLDQPIVRIDLTRGKKWTETPQSSNYPVFSGKLRRDTAYYGFDLAREDVLAKGRIDRTFLVFLEPHGRLRFGLDVGSTVSRARKVLGGARSSLDDWDDLSWSDMELTDAGYVRTNREIAKPPDADLDLWNDDRTSASLARSFWQKPIAAVLPLGLVLDGG